MAYPRILTIQDISCVGQCSLTVALPVISACGVETCVLPSAVLSTHTGGFTDFTFRDLTEDIPGICASWLKSGIQFDAIYTGYLGSARQIHHVKEIFRTVKKKDAPVIVDPAMADHGELYAGFGMDMVDAMKDLCQHADYVLPNITEACLLTGTEYRTEYDRDFILGLLEKMQAQGIRSIVLTGVSYDPDTTGVAIMENGRYHYYRHARLEKNCYGTGDIFASSFTGALMRGKTAPEAAKIAADFALECMKATAEEENHWYGTKFEPVLCKLIQALND